MNIERKNSHNYTLSECNDSSDSSKLLPEESKRFTVNILDIRALIRPASVEGGGSKKPEAMPQTNLSANKYISGFLRPLYNQIKFGT